MNKDALYQRAHKLVRLAGEATPGPWEAHRIKPHGRDWWVAGPLTPDGYAGICELHTGVVRGRIPTEANAKLIAAAPEMAEVLRILLSERDRKKIDDDA